MNFKDLTIKEKFILRALPVEGHQQTQWKKNCIHHALNDFPNLLYPLVGKTSLIVAAKNEYALAVLESKLTKELS